MNDTDKYFDRLGVEEDNSMIPPEDDDTVINREYGSGRDYSVLHRL